MRRLFGKPLFFERTSILFPLLVLLAAIAEDACAQQTPAAPVITTTGEVRRLTAEEAKLGIPVRLRGVVTYSEQTDFHAIFLQDETGGIYVEGLRDETIHQGHLIELDGVSAEGGFAPIVTARHWQVLGTAPLPAPLPATAAEMQGGQLDSQWLEIRGIVRAVSPQPAGRYYLEIAMERDSLRVFLSDFPENQIPTLIDSRVRVRGVCFTKRNPNRQWLANYLGVSGAGQIIREEPAPDPAALPVEPIARLFRFPPLGLDGHRVKVRGVVLCAQPGGMTFLQDETQAIQIQTPDNSGLSPGDQVEALGFPVPGGFYPVMEEAQLAGLGHEDAPALHARLPWPELLTGRFGTALVQVEARLVDSVQRPGESVFILQAAGQLFVARMSGARKAGALPPVGSTLRLSGVCLLPGVAHWEHAAPIRPASFEILLRDMSDVRVLEEPSWWTVRRVATLLAIVTGILVAAIIWVVLLRRRVAAQTKLIEHKIQREATIDERTRIARELHDTLAQGFVGIAFQLGSRGHAFGCGARSARGASRSRAHHGAA